MLQKHGKQFRIALRQSLLHRIGQSVDIGIQTGIRFYVRGDVGGILIGRPRKHVDIQLGDHHFHAQFLERGDGSVLLFDAGPSEAVVSLQAHGGDEHSLAFSFAISASAPSRLGSFSREWSL